MGSRELAQGCSRAKAKKVLVKAERSGAYFQAKEALAQEVPEPAELEQGCSQATAKKILVKVGRQAVPPALAKKAQVKAGLPMACFPEVEARTGEVPEPIEQARA